MKGPVGAGDTVGTSGVFWVLSCTGEKSPTSGNPTCELLLMAVAGSTAAGLSASLWEEADGNSLFLG